jgi:proteasome accessory factor B
MIETGLQLPPLRLTVAETIALFTAASNPALSRDNFYADDLRSGLTKLSLALDPVPEQESSADPPKFLAGYAVVGSLLMVTPDSVQRPTRELVHRAIKSNRKVRFHYWSRNSERAVETVVAPYDLRPMRNDWYLLAQAERGVEARIFKVSRMRGVEILSDRFRFPRHFSADHSFARALKAANEIDAEIIVKTRFSSFVAPIVLESHAHRLTDVQTELDGSIVCTLAVYNIREILWWILSYGADAEVLDPHDLRMRCADIAQSMAKLYASPP